MGIPHSSVQLSNLERDSTGNYIEPVGLGNDPLEVFSVVKEDDEEAIQVSGQIFSTIHTEQEYGNFHLQLQYKWGDKKWPPRENQRRDSGLLYAGFGEPGAINGKWMQSQELQIQEQDAGDYWAIGTVAIQATSVSVQIEDDPLGKDWFQYEPNGEQRIFGTFVTDNSQKFQNRRCRKSTDEELPHGEWNTVDLFFLNGNSIHAINGQVVNRLYKSERVTKQGNIPLTSGKILLQSEGAEVYYRDIKIRQISTIPNQFQ